MSVRAPIDLPPPGFWKLWLDHQPRLRARSLRHMRGHRPDAEEALGTTLLRAAAAFPRAPSALRDPEAWLTRILLNACADQYRLRSRHVLHAEAGTDALLGDTGAPCPSPSPEQRVLEQERASLLRRHVARLPDPLKAVCRLRLEDELDGASLARELGLTHVNARRRLMRATQVLRRALGPPEAPRARPQALA
ncbi:sigma-70 family RNA polymerase sigma factor [Myxococcus stipitatus]|uniref:RNA polymerase sigma factor n=1 Tax=Myxococcus stipitatus TaxID=83455 RepID=UPI001F175F13|nr:sigma-70 family RNA polymerase sigma factor [Myxococcus stipitatus]MCE9666442.1 sigma-70 family RNA polymerase sigma factor [Myxococcus stipitatus]